MTRVIALIPYPERGGAYPTFDLARKLRARGHRVVYFGAIDFEEDVLRQGFDHVTVFEDAIPLHSLDSDPRPESTLGALGNARWLVQQMSVLLRMRHRLRRSLVTGELVALLRSERIDAVLLDTLLAPCIAPALRCAGYPIVAFSTDGYFATSHAAPPNTSAIVSSAGLRGRVRCRAAWGARLVRHGWVTALGWVIELLTIRMAEPGAASVAKKARALARSSRLDWFFGEYGPRPVLPELVLNPRALEIPAGRARSRPARWPREYAGHCVDIARESLWEFPWHALGPGKPIVYASMGSYAAIYRCTRRVVDLVLDLARRRPELQFVVALGKGRRPDELADIPANLVAVPIAPQLRILERARVMITNAGMGTVKECVYYGVPIIALPQVNDQPGNAARVEHFGIGLRLNGDRVTGRQLEAAIDRCLHDRALRERVQDRSRALREEKGGDAVISFLEDQWGARPGAAPA